MGICSASVKVNASVNPPKIAPTANITVTTGIDAKVTTNTIVVQENLVVENKGGIVVDITPIGVQPVGELNIQFGTAGGLENVTPIDQMTITPQIDIGNKL
jgi:hypothetical protein